MLYPYLKRFRRRTAAMAEQLCLNPLQHNFLEDKIWDHPSQTHFGGQRNAAPLKLKKKNLCPNLWKIRKRLGHLACVGMNSMCLLLVRRALQARHHLLFLASIFFLLLSLVHAPFSAPTTKPFVASARLRLRRLRGTVRVLS